jgi:hypothetical protein
MVMLLHSSVLEIGLPLWIVRETSAPKALAAALFTFNTVVVVGLQVLAARAGEGVAAAARAYAWSAAALAAACGAFAAAAGLGTAVAIVLLVAAVLFLSIGEVLATVGEWGTSLGLAPIRGQGRYLALFSTGSAAQIVFGPFLVTALIVHAGIGSWAILAGIFSFAGLAAWTAARTAPVPEPEAVAA